MEERTAVEIRLQGGKLEMTEISPEQKSTR